MRAACTIWSWGRLRLSMYSVTETDSYVVDELRHLKAVQLARQEARSRGPRWQQFRGSEHSGLGRLVERLDGLFCSDPESPSCPACTFPSNPVLNRAYLSRWPIHPICKQLYISAIFWRLPIVKRLFQLTVIMALIFGGFAVGAKHSLRVFASSYQRARLSDPTPTPKPTPTPTRRTPAPQEPFPCLPRCPGQ